MHTRRIVCAVVILLTCAKIMFSQMISAPTPQPGTIMGTVLDTADNVVPGATIVLQGPTSGDQRRVSTAENGFFKVEDVSAGIPYFVSVNARGFANWRSSKIALRPGQAVILNGIKLRIATVQTTTVVVPTEVLAVQQVKAEEHQRIIGFIPNFYVSYDHDAVPLSTKLKFHLAIKTLTDPVTIAGFLMNAGMYQAGDYPSYQQGAAGFGQRLGATFTGGYTNVLVGNAVLPSLLHQDPRYFFQGTGSTKSRLLHAIVSPFITKGDDGRREFNYSNVGGDIASGAFANAYYPARDRGVGLVINSALIGAGGRMANAVAQEFLLHKFTSKHKGK